MSDGVGITAAAASRDRRRRETRERLVTAARELFAEYGFAAVSVAQIGAAAGLSAKTVNAYFPVKENLYFAESPPVDSRLLRSVRDRPAGESPFEAVRRHATRTEPGSTGLARAVRERAPGESVYEAIERYQARPRPVTTASASAAVFAHARVYTQSERLRAHAREQFARLERALAELLAVETSATFGDPLPGVVATALVAPLRWTFDACQDLLASGHPPVEVAGRRTRDLDSAYDLLGPALENYARREQPARNGPPGTARPEWPAGGR